MQQQQSQSPSGHENGYHIENRTTLSEIQTEWLPAAKAVIGGIMYLSFCSPILLVPALLKLALPKLLFSESWMVEKDFKKLSWPVDKIFKIYFPLQLASRYIHLVYWIIILKVLHILWKSFSKKSILYIPQRYGIQACILLDLGEGNQFLKMYCYL